MEKENYQTKALAGLPRSQGIESEITELDVDQADWGMIEKEVFIGRNLRQLVEKKTCIHQTDMVFLALCTRGSVLFKIDGQSFKAGRGSLVLVAPGRMVQIEYLKENSNGIGIGITQNLLKNAIVEYSNLWSLLLEAQKQPHVRILPSEARLIENLHAQLLETAHLPERPFKTEMLQSLMQAAIYQIAMIVNSCMEVRPLDNIREFNLYFRFTQSVTQNFRKSRRVDFYADLLCVSPKYLSAAVKTMSGKTANRWIDEYVTVEARNLLRISTNSIRQVSDYLNFPDASFFTKFFKRNTGMTPKEFRERYQQHSRDFGMDQDGSPRPVRRPCRPESRAEPQTNPPRTGSLNQAAMPFPSAGEMLPDPKKSTMNQ